MRNRKQLAKLLLAASICASAVFACGTLSSCDFGGITASTLTLKETKKTIYLGDTFKLVATTSSEDAVITWETSNPKVATVKRGTVTAKGVGEATITAKLEDGTSASCVVTVKDRTMTISQTEATINLDDEGEHTITLTAECSDGGAVTWVSSDTSIATVEGGVVTAVGDEIGEVVITAQRGLSYAECVIQVIMPSRPESFKRLTSAQNAACVADPGNWHYFADGSSSSVVFANKPYAYSGEDGKDVVGYSIAEVGEDFLKANGEGQKIFLRYQAAKDSVTGEELVAGDTYLIEFDAICNKNTHLTMGAGGKYVGADLVAGENKKVSFTMTLQETAPLAIRPSFEAAPTAEDTFDLTFSGITVTKQQPTLYEVTEDTTEVVPIDSTFTAITGAGEMTQAKNAECIADPGVMHYFFDGSAGTGYEIATAPAWNEDGASASFSLSKASHEAFYYYRYQPNAPADVTYAVTFTVESTQDGYIRYGTQGGTNFKERTITANTPLTVTYYGIVNSNQPFCVGIHSLNKSFNVTAETPLTFSIKDIAYKAADLPAPPAPETPDTTANVYDLPLYKNSETVAAAGTWAYFAAGDYKVKDAKYDNGTVTLSFTKMANNTYQIRYQPTQLDDGTALAVGDKYTVNFKVTVNYGAADTYILYGKDSQRFDFTQAGSYDLSWSGELNDSNPFMVQFKNYNATEEAPLEMILSDIEFVAYVEPSVPETPETPDTGETTDPTEPTDPTDPDTPAEPEVVTYDLQKLNKASTISNAGTWTYMADGTGGTNYVVNQADYNDGAITLSFSMMTADKNYKLQYQPKETDDGVALAAGDKYTITCKVTVNYGAEGDRLIYGKDYKRLDIPAAGTYDLSWTGELSATDPFNISLKNYDATADAPLTIVVSDVKIVAAA